MWGVATAVRAPAAAIRAASPAESRMSISNRASVALGFLSLLAPAQDLLAQGQPITPRSRRVGLQVDAHVTGGTAGAITVHGPATAPYLLMVTIDPLLVDFSQNFLGVVGPASLLSAPSIPATILTSSNLPSFFTVPPTEFPGVIPLGATNQTLTSTFTLPVGFALPLWWQALVVDFAPPLVPGPSVYATNEVKRRPTPPIAVPSVTGFTQGPVVPLTAGAVIRDVEQADVDGDGDLDTLLVYQAKPAQLYLNNTNVLGGLPSYLAPIAIPVPLPATTAEFADFDDDGFVDLAVGAANSAAYVTILRNQGLTANPPPAGQTFLGFVGSPAFQALAPGVLAHVNDLETGDFDLDGTIDIIAGCGDQPCVGEQNRLMMNRTALAGSLLLNDETFRLPGILDDTEDVEVFDADADGDLDVVVGNFDGPIPIEGQDFLLINTGAALFGLVPFGVPGETTDMLVADFNGDGFEDVYDARWLQNSSCGVTPYNNILFDQLFLNNAGGVPGNFIDASALLPDNPGYVGLPANRFGPWASLDAEAPRTPVGPNFVPRPVIMDYDHDGDVDIFVANGAFGSPDPLVNQFIPGIDRGIVIVQNQRAQAGSPPGALPPFIVDPNLFSLNDYTDLELGDWILFNAPDAEWTEKDIGAGTWLGGHFTIKKNQG